MTGRTEDEDFIFVVGCPRSGTYLLSTLLNQHFSISLPLETHFIHLFHRVIYLWGDLSEFNNRKALLDDIYDFLEVWMKIGHKDMDFDKAVPYSLLATRDKSHEIILESKNYQELVARLFSEYAKLHETERWGDKTVLYHHVSLEHLESSVPRAKIIHIIRDGRDVCMSWRNTWFGPNTLVEAARLWAQHLVRKRLWGVHNSDRYLEVKYEDLLEDKESVLKNIADFLNLKVSQLRESSYSSGMAQALEGPGTHQLLSRPIDKKNHDKWKNSMPHYERALFYQIAGSELKEFGYKTENLSISALYRIKFILSQITGSVRTFFSVNNFKRKLKVILPVVLLVTRKLHLPLLKILFYRS